MEILLGLIVLLFCCEDAMRKASKTAHRYLYTESRALDAPFQQHRWQMKEAGEVPSSHHRPWSSSIIAHLQFLQHVDYSESWHKNSAENKLHLLDLNLGWRKWPNPVNPKSELWSASTKRMEARCVRSLYAIGLCNPAFMHETRVWAFQIRDSGTGTQCVLYLQTCRKLRDATRCTADTWELCGRESDLEID